MQILTINDARTNLCLIINQAVENWSAIQETLYLLSLPDMRESIIEGLATPVEECSKELDW